MQQQRPDRRSKITQIKEVAQALATIRRDLSDPVTQVLCSDCLYIVILLGVAHIFGNAIETSPFSSLAHGDVLYRLLHLSLHEITCMLWQRMSMVHARRYR